MRTQVPASAQFTHLQAGGAEGHEQQCVTEATEGERGPSSRAEVGLYGGNLKGKEAGPELGQMRQNPWYAL